MFKLDHIPDEEKQKKWFILLDPIMNKRLLRDNFNESPLFIALKRIEGHASWKTIKSFIEIVLQNVTNGEKIFTRQEEVMNDPQPDNPIADMFAECRAVQYLLQKGFHELEYFRKNNIDFQAKFEDDLYYIEVTYLHGPDFKIFGGSNPDPSILKPGEKWDYSRKLMNFLKTKYLHKEKQILKKSLPVSKCLILMITDLMETHEPWFDHVKINEVHPIQYFVGTQKIATVLLGNGTLYEPGPDALGGKFKTLSKWSWNPNN